MFPKPSSLVEHLSHSECTSIINKGVKDPFTFNTLYQAPKEHTYQGHGRAFEEYNKDLSRKNQSLTFWRFLIFFKKENLIVNLTSVAIITIDFGLPLVLERFLIWIGDADQDSSTGGWLLSILVFISLLRMFSSFFNNYYNSILSAICKNAFEVKNLKKIKILLKFSEVQLDGFDEEVGELPRTGDQLCR